eukprot:TRINITY_DN1448_c0_g1_i10.p2 TRINITY_DN1448_c0_g1~~TRINITY_DN1448_c0_g1_i10.p2  ORF type:complete len:144 (-),score=11.58 TRINITY_DN1448_c0_g1_i10:444-875(-)
MVCGSPGGSFDSPVSLSVGDSRIVHVGCGYAFFWMLNEDGKLSTWGSGQYGQLGHGRIFIGFDVVTFEKTPKCVPGIRFQTPQYAAIWGLVFKWVFAGKSEEESILFCLPDEVAFVILSFYLRIFWAPEMLQPEMVKTTATGG